MRRYPLGPLLDAAARLTEAPRFDSQGRRRLNLSTPLPLRHLARMVQVHDRQVHRWRHEGLSERAADHAAVRLGLHPGAVWPEWWYAAA